MIKVPPPNEGKEIALPIERKSEFTRNSALEVGLYFSLKSN